VDAAGGVYVFAEQPLQSAYCGAKAAIENFTDSLRVELKHKGSAIELCQVHIASRSAPNRRCTTGR
jgi:short-subunit dehydrogenase